MYRRHLAGCLGGILPPTRARRPRHCRRDGGVTWLATRNSPGHPEQSGLGPTGEQGVILIFLSAVSSSPPETERLLVCHDGEDPKTAVAPRGYPPDDLQDVFFESSPDHAMPRGRPPSNWPGALFHWRTPPLPFSPSGQGARPRHHGIPAGLQPAPSVDTGFSPWPPLRGNVPFAAGFSRASRSGGFIQSFPPKWSHTPRRRWDHTLNRNLMMSPSRTTYSFDSSRNRPFSLTVFRSPASLRSA